MFIQDELYAQIVQSMPITCVDLVVVDRDERILLLRRKNEPAANQWWFPGGRVLFGELRSETAKRKLKEECGLSSCSDFKELGTFDWFFGFGKEQKAHSVTTLFRVLVDSTNDTVLDQQSYEACWQSARDWLRCDLKPMVLAGISMVCCDCSTNKLVSKSDATLLG